MIYRVYTLVLMTLFILAGCSTQPGPDPSPTSSSVVSEPTLTAVPPTTPPTLIPATEILPSPTVQEVVISPSPELPSPAENFQAENILRYRMQIGAPVAVANFISPESGCNWLGVGGQVFDLNGIPVTNLVVEIGGTLNGADIFRLGLTGSSTLLGPGGFVLNLSDHAIDSGGTLWILLYDLAGTPLTEKLAFPTYSDCNKNFTLVNLVEVAPGYKVRMILPIIFG